jgi:hypothetical protein
MVILNRKSKHQIQNIEPHTSSILKDAEITYYFCDKSIGPNIISSQGRQHLALNSNTIQAHALNKSLNPNQHIL